jgi:hypothetical protein
LPHFKNERKCAKIKQKKILSEQTLEKITQPLVTAIEKYQDNPRGALRHFKQQVIATGSELDERMAIIESDQLVLAERLAIINEKNKILAERLAIITKQDELLKERLAIIETQTETIAGLSQELDALKQRKWYRLGHKLGLL